ncbi:MAG: SH3 domain-containing protein [Chitinophagales bacterium]
MTKKLIIYLLFLTLPILLFAQDSPEVLFEQGNKAYADKDYETAAEKYEEVLDKGFQSPELYFNLGNAYYQLNKTGPTILNYEKALKRAPDDEDIRFNLKLANLRVADRATEATDLFFFSGFKNMLVNYASDRWAKLSLIFLWLSFILFAAFLWLKKAALKRLFFFSGIFSLLLTILFLVFSLQQLNYEKSKKSAIVMVTNTYVKSSPDPESTDLFILREGVKVKVLDNIDAWVKVRFSEEKVGWIEKEKLGFI